MAKANQLNAEIVTNSKLLDIVAERYDHAQQAVQETSTALSKIEDDLAANQVSLAATSLEVSGAEVAMRALAIDAYVGRGAARSPAEGVDAYLRGLSQATVETSVSRAEQQVQQLHDAQRRLAMVHDSISADQKRAATARTAAQTAVSQAQAAALSAATQQERLLASVSQVNGNLAILVAAARASQALAAFARLSGGKLLDFPTLGPVPAPPAPVTAAVQVAEAQVGKPYVWGAAGPDSFDCSGLTRWAWAQAGVAIPRVAADQQAWTVPVPISQLAPGDLVFFGSPAEHVGMYVGNGMMVNSPHSGATVEVTPIWWDNLTGFGRVHQP